MYVAYGDAARRECRESIESLRGCNPGLPVLVVGEPVKGARCLPFPRRDTGGRWAKLNADSLSPWPQTIYLDADTRVKADLSAGFRALERGWDLVIAPSARQGGDVLGNCPAEDREASFDALGTWEVLGLQAGVFFVAWNARTRALFAAWRAEWERFGATDQAALLRALWRVPVRLWLLGPDWNGAGGAVIEHRFGRARVA